MNDDHDVLSLDLANLTAFAGVAAPEGGIEDDQAPSDLVVPDTGPDTPEAIVLAARRRIELRCGRSSLVLYPDGRIVLRGDYILSDAESVNRLTGGQIELN